MLVYSGTVEPTGCLWKFGFLIAPPHTFVAVFRKYLSLRTISEMKVKQTTETYIKYKYTYDNGIYLKVFNVRVSVHR